MIFKKTIESKEIPIEGTVKFELPKVEVMQLIDWLDNLVQRAIRNEQLEIKRAETSATAAKESGEIRNKLLKQFQSNIC